MKLEDLKQYGLVYLGSPYSKYPPAYGNIFSGIEAAFIDVAQLGGRLVKNGICNFFSPICHTHPIAIYGKLDPLDHNIWLAFDEAMMNKCDAMVVAMMPTWQVSYGIKKEIEAFHAANKPVFYLDPETLEVNSQP